MTDISRPDVDIVWLHFGQHATEDWAGLQEVKATADPSLDYANRLLDDYAKLFGTDPRVTLRTRLDALKNKVEYQWNRPELARRLTLVGGPSPSEVSRVRILPTVVHELRGANPGDKMLVIRETLMGRGWQSELISCWSIGLDDFEARIRRLVTGL